MSTSEPDNAISDKITNLKIHGFPNAYLASAWPRRSAWLIITLVAMAFCLYGIITTSIFYYTYPVVVSVSVLDEALSSFPAVTLCNLNKRRKSQVAPRKFILSGLRPDRGSEADRTLAGHQLSDMLRRCNYKGRPCHATHFTVVNGSIGRYGNCYTFNSGFTKSVSVFNERITGRLGALELVLDAEPHEYMPTTESVGFEVKLHDSGQFPTPESKTISMAPGTSTFIELSQSRLRRAVKPYGDCEEISSEQNRLLNIWSRYGYNYSLAACKFSQEQLMMIDICRCYYYEMPAPEYLEDSTEPCSRFSPCILRVKTEFLATTSWSHVCPYTCEENLFETTVSSFKWPSAAGLKNFAWRLPRSNMSLEEVRESLAKVSIYYDSSRIKTIAEYPRYSSIIPLVGEIGGHLGLWVGVSLLAVCEFVEIAYDLAAVLIARIRSP